MFSFWFFHDNDAQPYHVATCDFNEGFEACVDRFGLVYYSPEEDALRAGKQVRIEAYGGTLVAIERP